MIKKLPWVEKYRPENIDDILLEPFVKMKINNILSTKKIPNLIISGEPSTGKTSTVLCLVKEVYKDNYKNNVLELNASDDRGLTIINNIIIPFCKKKADKTDYKLIILDEADSITSKALNSLNNIISDFTKNTRFIFICNDSTKIIESIQSRCMMLNFKKIKKKKIIDKVKFICEQEKIKYDIDSIKHLIFVSDYDIRQIINNLECIYFGYKKLTIDNIYKLFDQPKPNYINNILEKSLKGEIKEAIQIMKELYEKGYSPNDILLTFMKYLLNKDIKIDEEIKLKIYEIVSLSFIRVNDGISTLLQLCGCISKISLYLSK